MRRPPIWCLARCVPDCPALRFHRVILQEEKENFPHFRPGPRGNLPCFSALYFLFCTTNITHPPKGLESSEVTGYSLLHAEGYRMSILSGASPASGRALLRRYLFMLDAFLHALSAVFVLVCVAGLGWYSSAKGWYDEAGKRLVSKIVVSRSLSFSSIRSPQNSLTRSCWNCSASRGFLSWHSRSTSSRPG